MTALFNVYGQTEANSYLAQKIEHESDVSFPVKMGSVGSFADIRVQTSSGLEAEGVGELVVNGGNVARGYLGADYETLEPLSSVHGAGVFPTGDLVQIRDGLVDFRGRTGATISSDDISGQELEIRTRCNEIPGVVQSVIVRQGARTILVLEPQVASDSARLVAAAEALVPLSIHVAAKQYFPLNYNGKIDTRQLAESVSP